mgnify:CR=1 FL=1|jgi:hypothetical protein
MLLDGIGCILGTRKKPWDELLGSQDPMKWLSGAPKWETINWNGDDYSSAQKKELDEKDMATFERWISEGWIQTAGTPKALVTTDKMICKVSGIVEHHEYSVLWSGNVAGTRPQQPQPQPQ